MPEAYEVSVKPEYDKPGVLTIYDTVLVNNSTTPYSGDIVFLVPKDAQVSQTCLISPQGEHLCQNASTALTGEYQEVRWAVGDPVPPTGRYHAYLEYYGPIGTEPQRNISFVFATPYLIPKLSVAILAPKGARGFAIDPPAREQGTDAEGNLSYGYEYANVKPGGDPIRLTLRYVKYPPRNYTVMALVLFGGLGVSGLFLFAVRQRMAQLRVNNRPATNDRHAPGDRLAGSDRGTGPGQRGAPPAASLRSSTAGAPARTTAGPADTASQKRRARLLLLDGKISEATYRELIADIEAESAGKRG